MAEYDFILLGVALMLLACLYWRSWLRDRRESSERPSTGHGIDLTGISDRVERVRHDYVIELHSRPHAAAQRKDLLAMTRRAVGRLTYFRGRASRNDVSSEPDTESHTA